MSISEASEIARIRAEFERRDREIPHDFYAWKRPVNQYFRSQTARASIRALVEHGMFPLDDRTVLEIGSGAGSRLIEFQQWGARPANLAGIDLVEGRVQAARGHTHTLQLPSSVKPA